jgi:hypothetical protein
VVARPLGISFSLWWDATAKPFFRDFCMRFSKMVAHRHRESRNFFQVALEAALVAEDWAGVRGCRARLEDLDKALLRGRRVRVKGSPGGAEDPLSLAGEESRLKVGLEATRKENGEVLRDPILIEAEVVKYFEALFQGRHRAGAGDLAPVDSGLPFQPDFRRLGDFLQGLQSLSGDDRALVDLPITVPDLERAVEDTSLGRSPGLDGLSYEFYKRVMP